jgi:hypothetical protein
MSKKIIPVAVAKPGPISIYHYRHTSLDEGPKRVRMDYWPNDSFEVMDENKWQIFLGSINMINGMMGSTVINLVDGDIEEMEREAEQA